MDNCAYQKLVFNTDYTAIEFENDNEEVYNNAFKSHLEMNESDDESTVGTICDQDVLSSSNDYYNSQELYKTIKLDNCNLSFSDFFEFIEYLNNNIYYKNNYYQIKIKLNTHSIEWVFRKKSKIIKYIMKTFNLKNLYNIYNTYI
ncbi:hypothetical protein crov414 [Cafeteria roenbergensis virus]|uniref:Uncharacterized protein n=1 Tax=Cafeteria roenbergensis virus (strain BV-PW1) TaxID=693272 RepID=E3T5I5_CROVB|nr:hypothetical protein crov414 [Cafeteria roenbergensis virus BV-PW1]ADO67448.1 hypothetical protein crov414 [Cafeteria roenbergensis virus BV-PW1]